MKKKNLFIISFCLLALFSLSITYYYKRVKYGKKEGYISQIIQTGFEKEALKTSDLAQILGLSIDRPLSIASLNKKKLEETLLSIPFIKEAKVKQKESNALIIDYSVRKPVFWVADGGNLGMDKEAYLFPISPFFTPKNMPKLYLGLSGLEKIWNRRIDHPRIDKAFKIFSLFNGDPIRVKQIDVSNPLELVVILNQAGGLHYLRLTSNNYEKELRYYHALLSQLSLEKDCVIDLRVPNLAFIKK